MTTPDPTEVSERLHRMIGDYPHPPQTVADLLAQVAPLAVQTLTDIMRDPSIGRRERLAAAHYVLTRCGHEDYLLDMTEQLERQHNAELRVYLVDDGQAYKVGLSRNPEARVTTMQTGSGRPLTLVASRPGDRTEERRLHKLLAHHRLHGEWFSRHPDVVTTFLNATQQGQMHLLP